MKMGDASGVSTVDAVPSTMYSTSFFCFCSFASPGSVATRFDACLIYGMSGFGGRGPSYDCCAKAAQAAAISSGAILPSILGQYGTPEAPRRAGETLLSRPLYGFPENADDQ